MIYTVGHSTLSKEDFVSTFKPHVSLIVDARSHPGSKKWPQFNKEQLAQWLPEFGLEYEWWPGLGGWDVRHAQDENLRQTMYNCGVDLACYSKGAFPKQRIGKDRSNMELFGPNPDVPGRPVWTSQGLYDYSWFMILTEFLEAADKLIEVGRTKNVGYMCCECLWWKCHRSMISDYLFWRGVETYHIQPKLQCHAKSIGNRIERYHPSIIEAWDKWKTQSKL